MRNKVRTNDFNWGIQYSTVLVVRPITEFQESIRMDSFKLKERFSRRLPDQME